MDWRVYVSGVASDLSRLSQLIESGEVGLDISDPDAAYLHGPLFDSAQTASDALSLGKIVLPRLNAAGRLDSPHFTRLELTSRVHDGTTVHVFGEAHFHVRAHLTVGGDPGPVVTSRVFQAAQADDWFRQALELFGSSQDLSWGDLYKVYELILRASGGDLSARTGVSTKRLSSFRASANDAGISGIEARHAVPQEQPTSSPITLDEARELIRQMIIDWTPA